MSASSDEAAAADGLAGVAHLQARATAARAALLTQAQRLTSDEREAQQLVDEVEFQAMAPGAAPPADGGLTTWLSGLMRKAFHSAERRKAARRPDTQRGEWNLARAAFYAQPSRTSE